MRACLKDASCTPRIGIASHGNFLEQLFSQHGLSGHPNNAQVTRGILPIEFDEHDEPQGFGNLQVDGILNKGIGSTATLLFMWFVTFLLGCVVAYIGYKRFSKRIAKAYEGGNYHPLQSQS